MKRPDLLYAILIVFCLLWLPGLARAQGTLEDYLRADELEEKYKGLAVNVAENPTWLEDAARFWYRKSVKGGHRFVLVDVDELEKRDAFDHGRLAHVLSIAEEKHLDPIKLPFDRIKYVGGGDSLEVRIEDKRYICALSTYVCESIFDPLPERRGWGRWDDEPEPRRREHSVTSPDGRYFATVRDNNLYLHTVESGETKPLSMDGTEGNFYEPYSIRWSPNSRYIAIYRVRPGYRRTLHYVESAPDEQLQPRHRSRTYLKPGDVLDLQQPVLFDVVDRKKIDVDNALFPDPYELSRIEWRQDSRAFTFEYNQRGHQVYRVIEVEAETGETRAVISEEPETFFYYRHSSEQGKRFRYDVNDGEEIIWMSERDGWNHLYLYDGATGRVKNQITKGEWVVRDVDSVDVDKRQIWFHASGMYPGKDPYYIHYFRVNFDGSGLTPLTEEHGTHSVTYSPDMKYYIDSWSRVDLAPVMQLRRTSDRALLMELERGDLSDLKAAGWNPPEPFTALGRDGKTEIWGLITRPSNFDPNKKYPVIEYIYAGPHWSFVQKAFGLNTYLQSLAELGFIVVQIDGMGTSNRSKAFHDVAWKNLGDAGFPDRILWHQAVAERYPYYDITRVGIFGTSAGGQSSLGALLFHPEFYDVAVSSSGCHDNRMDKIWWNELWMSWPVGPHYEAASNVVNAHRLEGNLLLIVGEMDTNVDPSSTFQVVDALIEAEKDFDLIVIPGGGHTSGGTFGEHKRRDFFVKHLLGVDPPAWRELAAAKKTRLAASEGHENSTR